MEFVIVCDEQMDGNLQSGGLRYALMDRRSIFILFHLPSYYPSTCRAIILRFVYCHDFRLTPICGLVGIYLIRLLRLFISRCIIGTRCHWQSIGRRLIGLTFMFIC